MNADFESIFTEIKNAFQVFEENHDKNVDKGNKSAGQRARKAIGEIKKLATAYRKASVEANKKD